MSPMELKNYKAKTVEDILVEIENNSCEIVSMNDLYRDKEEVVIEDNSTISYD